jgi:hypothetical protein
VEKERPNPQYTADIPPPDNGQSPGKIDSIRPLSKKPKEAELQTVSSSVKQ